MREILWHQGMGIWRLQEGVFMAPGDGDMVDRCGGYGGCMRRIWWLHEEDMVVT